MRIQSTCLLIGLAVLVLGCRYVVKDPDLVGQLNASDWTIASEPKADESEKAPEVDTPPQATPAP